MFKNATNVRMQIMCAFVTKKYVEIPDVIYKEESYEIIGKCFEVHNNFGPGFLKIVYKDALELEFKNAGIPFDREV